MVGASWRPAHTRRSLPAPSLALSPSHPPAEDYNWWWRSFLTSGSSALYLFGYAIVYFVTKLEITLPSSVALYFGYMAMASWVFFLLTGSIGFVATLFFVTKIFSVVKVD
jgi:transmembrane 9 superfamily member 2/4